MNLEIVAGRWKQVRGAVLCKWGRFTANQFAVFVGEQDCINGRIQARLGLLRTTRHRGARLAP
jgi:uncharacterized protein YjbJ (UPF0337 family)